MRFKHPMSEIMKMMKTMVYDVFLKILTFYQNFLLANLRISKHDHFQQQKFWVLFHGLSAFLVAKYQWRKIVHIFIPRQQHARFQNNGLLLEQLQDRQIDPGFYLPSNRFHLLYENNLLLFLRQRRVYVYREIK